MPFRAAEGTRRSARLALALVTWTGRSSSVMPHNRKPVRGEHLVEDKIPRTGGSPSRSQLDALRLAAQVEGLRGRPELLDARSLKAVQAAAGNAAVVAALQRDLAVQRTNGATKKIKKPPRGNVKRKSADLTRLIEASMESCRGPGGGTAYDALSDMLETVAAEPTLEELNDVEQEFHQFRAAHAGALTLAVAPHPAGSHIADSQGNLLLQHPATIRNTFYPTNYLQHATTAKMNWINTNPGGQPGTVLCPGHRLQGPHDVAPTDITIDHVVDVCTHWNQGLGTTYGPGRDSDKATRVAFYNHVPNHAYLCRSCNTSKGAGGAHYNKRVGMNFTN